MVLSDRKNKGFYKVLRKIFFENFSECSNLITKFSSSDELKIWIHLAHEEKKKI